MDSRLEQELEALKDKASDAFEAITDWATEKIESLEKDVETAEKERDDAIQRAEDVEGKV